MKLFRVCLYEKVVNMAKFKFMFIVLQAPIPKSGLERRGFSREIIEAISGLNQI